MVRVDCKVRCDVIASLSLRQEFRLLHRHLQKEGERLYLCSLMPATNYRHVSTFITLIHINGSAPGMPL
jgi:hypothetical protein